MTNDEQNVMINNSYDIETRKYITFMCKKGCKFYENGCTKKRVVRECVKNHLKNKE